MKRYRARTVTKTATIAAAAVLLSLTALLAGGLSAAPRAAAASTSTFTTTLFTEVSTLNPFLAYFDGETEVLDDIYPSLTWLNERNQPSPYLARSWNISSDKRTWTFHLQKGLKWSDGQPLTANDVAWTLNLIMHNSTAATANGSLVANFKSVAAPNADTVTVTTKTPQSNMLTLVAIPIVPEHIWKSKLKTLGKFTNLKAPVVGYGPFTLGGYKTSQYVTLKANEHFFLGPPKYKTVILYYFSNSEGAVSALRSGEVDQTDDLTATEWKALQKVKGITTYQTLANAWEAVEVNADARTRSGKHLGNGNPILADPIVRQAIAYGINRPELAKKVLGGLGSAGSTYLPPAFPEWKWTPPAGSSSTYDPGKAKQLLTAAGYPLGKNGYRYDKKTGKPLTFRLGIHSDYNSDAQDASYLVGWMKDIGIKLKVQSMSTTQLNDDLAKGDWDLLMDAWATAEDPTYLLSIQTCGVLPLNNGSGGNTDSFFCNKKFDRLYNAEQTDFNAATRAADIRQMEKILYQANYDIVLYYNNTISAIHTPYMKGFIYGTKNASGFYPLQNEELGWVRAVPAADAPGGSSTGLIIGIVVAVVVVAAAGAGVLMLRRRRTAADRE